MNNMIKIEGRYYDFRGKENHDLSDVNVVRFYFSENDFIDVRLENGVIDINASSAIKIIPTAGSNCIKVAINNI